MSDSTDLVLAIQNEQFSPAASHEGAAPNDVPFTVDISAEMRRLASLFLDTQSPDSNGLTIEYVKTIRFEELVSRLRRPEVTSLTAEMIRTIQILIRSLGTEHGDLAQTVDNQEYVFFNSRVILAAYMTAFYKNHVFEYMDVCENKLVESSTQFLTNFEAISNYILVNTTINAEVTKDFYRLINTYLRDFNEWKEPDNGRMANRIVNALQAIYLVLANMPTLEDNELELETVDPARIELENQIESLRAKLLQCNFQTELGRLDEWRQVVLPSLIRTQSATPQYFTNEELLQLTSRLARENTSFFLGSKVISVPDEQIVHELLIDSSFQFGDDGLIGPEGRASATNQESIDTFWGAIIEDMKQPEPRFTEVLQVLKDILDGISAVAGSMPAQGEETVAVINIEEILTPGILTDWNSCKVFFDDIFKMICRAQMQKREDSIKAKWDILRASMQSALPDDWPDCICTTIKVFSDHVKGMCIDSCNNRISLLSHAIMDNGVKYEQDRIKAMFENRTLTLEKTTEWLYQEINCIPVKQFKELVNGNMETIRSVHRAALINLVIDTTIDKFCAECIPEVLHLDLHRIQYFSGQYQMLVNCATIMRIISDFVPEVHTQDEEPGQNLALLKSISDIVLACNPKKIEDIRTLSDVIEQTQLQKLITPERMEAMRVEMELAVSDEHYATRATVSRRIIYYLKQFNVLQADTEPLHSVYSVATKITEVARSLSALAALNIKIHLPVFKLVIAGVAQDISTPGHTVMPLEAAVSADLSTISAPPLENVEAEISEADSDGSDETDVAAAVMAFAST